MIINDYTPLSNNSVMKRLCLLSLFLLLSSIIKAFDVKIENLYYNLNLNEKQAQVTYNTGYAGDIIIPSEITCDNIKYAVTSIGDSAFWGNIALSSIIIPSSITSIENNAFNGCSSLQEVNIPNGVISIGNSAFIHCSKLTSISLSTTVTSIGDLAFYDCKNLTSITIPKGVKTIGSQAFNGCFNLSSITNSSLVL